MRDHARINLDIWGDDDWLDLSPCAQHLYFVLYTAPGLSFCGTCDWCPSRLVTRARRWTVREVDSAAGELVEGLFIVIDLSTSEVLVRSWIKHDGLYKVPNMAVAIANARADVASRIIRGVIVHEVRKLHDSEPELKAWNRPAVVKMLHQRTVDPAEHLASNPWNETAAMSAGGSPKGSATASPSGSGSGSASGSATGSGSGSAEGTDSGSPTQAPTPTPQRQQQKREPAKRGHRVPEDWKPAHETVAWARKEFPDVDLRREHQKFMNYWLAKSGKDATKLDWDRTWRNWIIRATESVPRNSRGRTGSSQDDKVREWLTVADDPPADTLDLPELEGG